jgi:hypothetical protein
LFDSFWPKFEKVMEEKENRKRKKKKRKEKKIEKGPRGSLSAHHQRQPAAHPGKFQTGISLPHTSLTRGPALSASPPSSSRYSRRRESPISA